MDTSWLLSQERPFIDLLPVELLERVIALGVAAEYHYPNHGRRIIRRICMWQRVCRRWKDVIDDCPSLWSTITVDDETNVKDVKLLLEKSRAAPLDLEINPRAYALRDNDLTQLVVDSAYRWQRVLFWGYPGKIIRRLGSAPPMLDCLSIKIADIPKDCRFFSLIRPNLLRKLVLERVTIPHDFDPTLGLEELYVEDVNEGREDGQRWRLSSRKFHQFLQSNPSLQTLEVRYPGPQGQYLTKSPNDHDLQPVDLPKLKTVVMGIPHPWHLFRAEHCIDVCFWGRCLKRRPPPSAWVTPAHTLRRVKSINISVEYTLLSITAEAEPYNVRVTLDQLTLDEEVTDPERLFYSILQDILNEAEKDTPISARVELGLFFRGRPFKGSHLGLELLKLLQTPIWDPSSGESRWRLPNLDTINILDPGLPYHHLRAFIQARSNGNCVQPASSITGIFIRSDSRYYKGGKDVLNEVMACTGGENDG